MVAHYVECFFATLFFSTLFSIGGLGSAIILIPVLGFLGVNFTMAKAAGLFVNTVTTSTASFMNALKGALDLRLAIPFVSMSVLCAPLGTYVGHMLDVRYVKFGFALFLFYFAFAMFRSKKPAGGVDRSKAWIFYPLGVVVGILAGLLGIGGGALIVPALFYVGLEPKKIAINASFMIPFSTLSAFVTYVYTIEIDWVLIGVIVSAAMIGGYTGNRIMHLNMEEAYLRKFLAVVIFFAGCRMVYEFFIGAL